MRTRTRLIIATAGVAAIAAIAAILYVGSIRSDITGVVRELNISNGSIRSQYRVNGWVLVETRSTTWISQTLGSGAAATPRWKTVEYQALLEPISLWHECSLFRWSHSVAQMNELAGLATAGSFTPAASQQVAKTIINLWCADDEPRRAHAYVEQLEKAVYGHQSNPVAFDLGDLPAPLPSSD